MVTKAFESCFIGKFPPFAFHWRGALLLCAANPFMLTVRAPPSAAASMSHPLRLPQCLKALSFTILLWLCALSSEWSVEHFFGVGNNDLFDEDHYMKVDEIFRM